MDTGSICDFNIRTPIIAHHKNFSTEILGNFFYGTFM